MTTSFGETLRRLRTEKGLSQQQLAVRLHMERPSVANWEAGRRMPDAATVYQIAEALSVDSSALLSAADDSGEAPNVLLVDDEPLIVTEGIPVLQEAMPNANVVGFTKPSQVLAFFSENPVALAFLDIELGRTSGLELCREMLRLRPRTNVIYLTAFREYAFDAWDTGACGYLLKPLETETVRAQLSRLRYPVKGLL
ncbi:MAG: response regulator [Clostridia bacterium]|nr:response regulator [Clostridia bacterium]